MNVLIAFECSGAVRDAFRNNGHRAWSVDLEPGEGAWSRYHIQGDALQAIDQQPWDLVIAHPPCTAVAVSGNRYYANTDARDAGVRYIMDLASVLSWRAKRWAIENPVGCLSTAWRKPDQYIQPWQFGHDAAKKTGLWLQDLPKLMPTDSLGLPERGHWANQTPSGQNKLGPSGSRAKERSKTYDGIAMAMATQWGRLA
jgi:hypothetical protein